MMVKKERNKWMRKKEGRKGVSLLVSYVLLIMLTVTMAGLIYGFLKYKTKLPEEIKCPDGVSIYLYNYTCETGDGNSELNLTFKNNGLFNIKGVNIKIYRSAGICTNNFRFNNKQYLEPGELGNVTISNNECDISNINKIEVMPYRLEKKGEIERIIYCSDAREVYDIDISC